jgi:hypothetical protein
MIRTPLRPLARILPARARGDNPDAIERENLRLRLEATRARARVMAEGRLLVLGVLFFTAFSVIGARMGLMAASQPAEPQSVAATDGISSQRADIVDRRGRLLATNLVTNALYAQPPLMVDPARAARALAAIFPDENAERLLARFTQPGRKFIWIRKQLSPEQMQAVHEIGEPGLLFGRARCGFIPTANWPRMCWAAPVSAAKASAPPKCWALRASRKPRMTGCAIPPMPIRHCACRWICRYRRRCAMSCQRAWA